LMEEFIDAMDSRDLATTNGLRGFDRFGGRLHL
jgi:hypothetical protein